MMPAIVNPNSSLKRDYNVAGHTNTSLEVTNFETQSQIGEILKDAHTQNRVVDNVMNFFRYKDSENNKHTSKNSNLLLMEQPQHIYTDNTYTALTSNLNSANNSIGHGITKLPNTTVGGNGTLQGFGALDIFTNTQASI